MAKRKLGVSLSPIAAQIDKAEKNLRKLKPRVSPADRKKIDLEIKDLKKIRKAVAKACGGKMTPGLSPA